MASPVMTLDVLILGGGAGGSAAAWQASKLGARVLVVEETPWLGGMITAAGVSAFDGNKGAMGSGFFRRLRDALEQRYGGPKGVQTGWISDTCFEPHVAARLLAEWVPEHGAIVWNGARLVSITVTNGRVMGAVIERQGEQVEVRAHVTIDATEYGDAMALAEIPYDLGREAQRDTGEEHAPPAPDMEIQDLTWCATLKLFPGGAPPLPKPINYDPREFDCALSEICSTPDTKLLNHHLHDWESFITYAALPNDKYLLNWPFHANDSPDTLGVFGTAQERKEAFRRAKIRTMCFIYYIQNELGHSEWGLAIDEYGTPDNLPFLPYIRESRRLRGVRTMHEQDVLPPHGCRRALFQHDSIAVGDYYLDHHHSKAHLPPGKRLVENYPDNAPFMIPYKSLVPEWMEGFLAAEKNISVSHIVNGCTRLQPCVMLTGQAAGAAAAIAARKKIEPRDVSVAELQMTLIGEGVAVYPTYDVHNTHPAFKAIQRLSIRGLCFDHDPMNFEPDKVVTADEATRWLNRLVDVTHKTLGDLASLHRPGMTKGELFLKLEGEVD